MRKTKMAEEINVLIQRRITEKQEQGTPLTWRIRTTNRWVAESLEIHR